MRVEKKVNKTSEI